MKENEGKHASRQQSVCLFTTLPTHAIGWEGMFCNNCTVWPGLAWPGLAYSLHEQLVKEYYHHPLDMHSLRNVAKPNVEVTTRPNGKIIMLPLISRLDRRRINRANNQSK
mmetsp:Transcript_13474/g.31504  ORF Transcript_13474/g.31504 Transcript_13474/m.31504 type:complete len:110 (+) Transcript_13474:292-621(+)